MNYDSKKRPSSRLTLGRVLSCVALWWVSSTFICTRSSAQTLLWDHIGDGVREVELNAFDSLGDIDGDGRADFMQSVQPQTSNDQEEKLRNLLQPTTRC